MRTFLFTVRPVLDVLASVAAVSPLIRAGISALIVAVLARAISRFVGARDVFARSQTAGAQFEMTTGQTLKGIADATRSEGIVG